MIKTITLRYDEKNFRQLEKIKSNRQMSWEDFVFWCICNYGREK